MGAQVLGRQLKAFTVVKFNHQSFAFALVAQLHGLSFAHLFCLAAVFGLTVSCSMRLHEANTQLIVSCMPSARAKSSRLRFSAPQQWKPGSASATMENMTDTAIM